MDLKFLVLLRFGENFDVRIWLDLYFGVLNKFLVVCVCLVVVGLISCCLNELCFFCFVLLDLFIKGLFVKEWDCVF